ncbi:fumarate hydratase C-terminal domain-containing protein [uncultured Draconibacterium sp.]|uniref:fumarate hydratase C-terminal domain-containing protein n=1 Tax=uncultured Draconibacterium sp. TaxID=1573823 RepID=UPI0025DD5C51|nr:fumarate hydratase C-terminal domain-containing protein [uncultured Draconibacterium sp.]
MIKIQTPITNSIIEKLTVGDMISISGFIYTGRDAVLPKIVTLIENNQIQALEINLKGAVIFHTAVSPAGVGPTSSNKFDIESSIPTLSKAGVKLHLGKGALKPETIAELKKHNSVFAVIPPVTALLKDKTISKKVVAFPELGMEALHLLEIKDFPAIIAAVNGKSIYDEL